MEYFAACAMIFDVVRHFEYREDPGDGVVYKSVQNYKYGRESIQTIFRAVASPFNVLQQVKSATVWVEKCFLVIWILKIKKTLRN